MTQEEKNNIKQVMEYLSKGVNRPMNEFHIQYDSITHYPKLVKTNDSKEKK